jgi:hypothetical protein
MWLNNVFPVAIPHGPQYAHGDRLSPGAFALHDLSHGSGFCWMSSVSEFFRTRAIVLSLSSEELSEAQAVTFYAPYAAQRYGIFQSALKDLYMKFLNVLLPDEGEAVYGQVLAGWFFMGHEAAVPCPASVWENPSLVNILEEVKKGALVAVQLRAQNTREELAILAKPHTREEMIRHAFLQGVGSPTLDEKFQSVLASVPPDGMQGKYEELMQGVSKEWEATCCANATLLATKGRGFEVHFALPDGTKREISIDDAQEYWRKDLGDHAKLLRFVGIPIQTPDFTAPSPGIFADIDQKLEGILALFFEKAIEYLERPDDDGESIAMQYARAWQKNDTAMVLAREELVIKTKASKTV